MEHPMGDEMRPQVWADFIGQDALKARLDVHIQSAVARVAPLDHVLLTGPPGFGKTSLATIIANNLGDPLDTITVGVGTKARDFIEFFKRVDYGCVLVDEIHSAGREIQEHLQTLLLDKYIAVSAHSKIHIPRLTVIGATTEPEKILAPLHDRFIIHPVFAPYSEAEMATIVARMAVKADVVITEGTARALGRAAGGTPRNARSMVFVTRDLTLRLGREPSVAEILDLCQVDPDGLTHQHMRYLKCIDQAGGVAGLKTISSHLRLHESILRDLERVLVSHNLITFSAGGRELTRAGHMKASGTTASPRQQSRLAVA